MFLNSSNTHRIASFMKNITQFDLHNFTYIELYYTMWVLYVYESVQNVPLCIIHSVIINIRLHDIQDYSIFTKMFIFQENFKIMHLAHS